MRKQLLTRCETYSAGLPSVSLELRVVQWALRDGCSAREVALVLVTGSEVVRQIYDRQGRKEAMVKDRPQKAIAFDQHIVIIARQQQPQQVEALGYGEGLEM